MSPVRDGLRLRDRPERKPIIIENYYTALDYTETLELENDHISKKSHFCIQNISLWWEETVVALERI